MDTELTTRNHTRQSHILVNAPYALKKNEIDIVLTLLTAITKDDKDFKDYQFTIKELEIKTNRKWQSKQLESTIIGLLAKPIKLPTNSKRGFEYVSWFSYFKYDDSGLITCRFDKALKPYLIDIVGTRILSDFRHLLPMKSSYSKRMYLLLKEYDKIGKRVLNVEKLQDILTVPKSLKNYADFKRNVLKRAEADINKFTDIEVKLSEKKRLRKVVEVTYTIKKNHTDLKAFISSIRELYINELLFNTKENRPLKCSEKGLLYYSDTNQSIDQKEAQKLWEYLHENRENLYVFKKNLEESKKHLYLSSMQYFQEYIKEHFANQEIIRLKKSNREDEIVLSIFPNGRLYDMSGEYLDDTTIVEIWKIIYTKAKKDELRIFNEG
jgi:plasmid replication initiation protein